MNPIPAPEPEAPHSSLTINGRCDLDHPVLTFVAYRKDTGEAITVDDRTFDIATMSQEPPVEVA